MKGAMPRNQSPSTDDTNLITASLSRKGPSDKLISCSFNRRNLRPKVRDQVFSTLVKNGCAQYLQLTSRLVQASTVVQAGHLRSPNATNQSLLLH